MSFSDPTKLRACNGLGEQPSRVIRFCPQGPLCPIQGLFVPPRRDLGVRNTSAEGSRKPIQRA
jgi:hypothetical protein